jgi:molybdate transport system substrate-binding protein
MALIDAVPAGMYGKAALEALDLWTDVQGQVVQTDHVRSALRLVALGEVRWGIVYRSDVLADPTVFLAAEFPPDTHPPIVYPVALTVRNEPSKGATAFHAYLKSERARQILTKHGFQPPVENRS